VQHACTPLLYFLHNLTSWYPVSSIAEHFFGELAVVSQWI
jgi:hypothetical protein